MRRDPRGCGSHSSSARRATPCVLAFRAVRPTRSRSRRGAEQERPQREAPISSRSATRCRAVRRRSSMRSSCPRRCTTPIVAARDITSHGAGCGSDSYIGKLMRNIDAEPIRAALERRRDVDRARLRSERQIEQWRDRLLADERCGLAASWRRSHPDARPRRAALTRETGTRRTGLGPPARGRAQLFRATAQPARGAAPRTDAPVVAVYNAAVKPLVGIIMGSTSDWETLKTAADTLERLGVAVRGARRLGASHARPAVRVRRDRARSRAARSSSPVPAAPRTCPA